MFLLLFVLCMSLGVISEVALCVYTLYMVLCLALLGPLHSRPTSQAILLLLQKYLPGGFWQPKWRNNAPRFKQLSKTDCWQWQLLKLQYQWGQENRLGPAKTLGCVKVRTLGFVKCITLDFVGVYIGPLMSDFRNWALDLFVAKFLRCMALMSF